MTNSKSKRALSLLCAFLMLAALSAFFCIDTTVAFAAETSGSWEYKTVSGGACPQGRGDSPGGAGGGGHPSALRPGRQPAHAPAGGGRPHRHLPVLCIAPL